MWKLLFGAALLQQSIGERDDARNLVRLLPSMGIFDNALEELIKEHFGLDEFKLS
jgi:hypothetical protein